MTVQEIRTRYQARPFKPFILHLADGRAIPVEQPEFMAFAPSGRTIAVYQPDSSSDIIDLSLVTDLELKPDGSSS
ncbi:MAG: hypothetical protein QME81_04805 [bacterium]|nr:hypothetical protein [bacterium]